MTGRKRLNDAARARILELVREGWKREAIALEVGFSYVTIRKVAIAAGLRGPVGGRRVSDEAIRDIREWHAARRAWIEQGKALGTGEAKAKQRRCSLSLVERICRDPTYRADA